MKKTIPAFILIFVLLLSFVTFAEPLNDDVILVKAPNGKAITISTNGLTVNLSGEQRLAIASVGKITGKWYWETKINTVSVSETGAVGIALNSVSTDKNGNAKGLLSNYNHRGIINGYGAPSYKANDVIGYALDLEVGNIIYYKNGIIVGQAIIPPSFLGQEIYPILYHNNSPGYYSTSNITANFGASSFVYPVPNGYLPYSYSESNEPDDSDNSRLKILLTTGESLKLIVGSSVEDNVNYSWASSDNNVASVDINGKVIGNAVGDATITVEKTGYSDTILIKVIDSNTEPQPSTDSIVLNDNDTGTGLNQIEYSQGWTYHSQNGAYNNDETYANSAGSYFQVAFEGNKIVWYGAYNNTCGMVDVYLDGVLIDTVDCYQPTRSDTQPFFDSGTLTNGAHTLKVVLRADKNSQSSNYYITVDKIDIN